MKKVILILAVIALFIGMATMPVGANLKNDTQNKYLETQTITENPQEFEWNRIVRIDSPIHNISTFDCKGIICIYHIENITGKAHWLTISGIFGRKLFDDVYWQNVTLKVERFIGTIRRDSPEHVTIHGYAIGVKVTVY